MATNSRWGNWTELLSGLPFDVQSRLYYVLSNYEGLNPASCYRLPFLSSTQRQQVAAGGQAVDQWRFVTLTSVYGISTSFSNETVGAGGIGVSDLTPVYPDEVNVNINFNNAATTMFGTAQEPCTLGSIGDRNHATRIDPITAVRNDTWNITWQGQAGLLNPIFSTVTLHGVKIYSASGAV